MIVSLFFDRLSHKDFGEIKLALMVKLIRAVTVTQLFDLGLFSTPRVRLQQSTEILLNSQDEHQMM